jgi:hypothetical protein
MNYQQKIISLWTAFLLGLLFHTQLGLMPLFHGLNVAESYAHTISDVAWVMWLMLGFFVLPILAIIATAFTDSGRYRLTHFGLTVVYSVLNLLHIAFDLSVQPIFWYQIALVSLLFLIGSLLNIVAWGWMQLPSESGKLYDKQITSLS